ncbi:MAG: hypothetical protein JO157_12145 [Acetobacteraceae bacterium]|nr:hypothetical protein [Acetobacteraceae bacterium]
MAGAGSLHALANTLAALCVIAGVVSVSWAVLGRETLGRGSLNRWDEALAFAALSRLAHLAHGGFHV